MTPSVLRRRLPAAVNRGAELLDEREPGWARKVKLTTLDMHDADCCVLGQLHGDYADGLIEVGIPQLPGIGEDEVRFGFHIPDEWGGVDGDRDDETERLLWADLDVLWRDAIRQRRAK